VYDTSPNECHTDVVGNLFDTLTLTPQEIDIHVCASWDWLLMGTKLSSIGMLILADVSFVCLLSF